MQINILDAHLRANAKSGAEIARSVLAGAQRGTLTEADRWSLRKIEPCCSATLGLLGAISNNEDAGDISTLANPEIVDEIRKMKS